MQDAVIPPPCLQKVRTTWALSTGSGFASRNFFCQSTSHFGHLLPSAFPLVGSMQTVMGLLSAIKTKQNKVIGKPRHCGRKGPCNETSWLDPASRLDLPLPGFRVITLEFASLLELPVPFLWLFQWLLMPTWLFIAPLLTLGESRLSVPSWLRTRGIPVPSLGFGGSCSGVSWPCTFPQAEESWEP